MRRRLVTRLLALVLVLSAGVGLAACGSPAGDGQLDPPTTTK